MESSQISKVRSGCRPRHTRSGSRRLAARYGTVVGFGLVEAPRVQHQAGAGRWQATGPTDPAGAANKALADRSGLHLRWPGGRTPL